MRTLLAAWATAACTVRIMFASSGNEALTDLTIAVPVSILLGIEVPLLWRSRNNEKAPADREVAGVFFTERRHFQEAGTEEETFRR